MTSFVVYEDFVAQFQILASNMVISPDSTCGYHTSFNQGVEVMARAVAPELERGKCARKGLTFNDLVIKVSHPAVCSTRLTLRAGSTNLQVSFALCGVNQANASWG